MDLVGAWLRQLLRAGTAAAIVPVAMLAALVVVLVGAGGFGGLGSLGQLFAGPEISPAESFAVADDPQGSDLAPVAPAAPAAAAGSAGARRTPVARSIRRGGVQRRPSRPVVRSSPPPLDDLPPPPRPLPPRGPRPQPAPPPAPAGEPVLKDNVDQALSEVGSVVEEIINRVGESVGRLGDVLPSLH